MKASQISYPKSSKKNRVSLNVNERDDLFTGRQSTAIGSVEIGLSTDAARLHLDMLANSNMNIVLMVQSCSET